MNSSRLSSHELLEDKDDDELGHSESEGCIGGRRSENPGLSEEDVLTLEYKVIKLQSSRSMMIETGSPYGTAFVLPQIARCTNYNKTFVFLAIRSIFVLYLCLFLQINLLCFVGKSTQIMAPLGGQMHLCDFGGNFERCPDADDCTGPGGTKYTRTRLYGYTQWTVQNFVKQALLTIAPEKRELIEDKVDPGEYGMESYVCRLMCVALFLAAVVPELFSCVDLAELLFWLPTDPIQSEWIRHKKSAKEFKYKIAGIPIFHKILYAMFFLAPKCAILHFVMRVGVNLLMDTPAILDMILGSMSMTFIFSIDELVFKSFASDAARDIMLRFGDGSYTRPGHADKGHVTLFTALWEIFPMKMVVLVLLTAFYVHTYYHAKCRQVDGQWVSKDMHLPLTASYHIQDFVLDAVFRTVKRSAKPFWTMPTESTD